MPILTIDSARLNGTPSAGTVRITASRSPLMDSGNNTVYSGTQTFPLDAQGKLSVSLPATDSPSIGPFTYTVEANLASGQWIYRGVKLPANVATIDITDAQSASQNMYPTRQEWDAITAGMNTAIEGKVTGTGMTVRHDTSAGTRVFLDHPGGSLMLYGDTGWRDMSERFVAGWTGKVIARRVNNTVELRFTELDGTNATQNGMISSLTPFASSGGRLTAFALNGDGGSSGTEMKFLSTSGSLNQLWRGRPEDFAGTGAATAVFTTDYAWPTSLPGLPVT